ncbi:zinc finger and SCAN domain-containing protein 2-like isoform X2 [Liolophura sinensis]|uniref:zinc finger and SCAN domain-containing protein 2-like isoform X2 n=1 Tax=Liolophura sinensis TaxID=3198878 RepID=UPI003159259C
MESEERDLCKHCKKPFERRPKGYHRQRCSLLLPEIKTGFYCLTCFKLLKRGSVPFPGNSALVTGSTNSQNISSECPLTNLSSANLEIHSCGTRAEMQTKTSGMSSRILNGNKNHRNISCDPAVSLCEEESKKLMKNCVSDSSCQSDTPALNMAYSGNQNRSWMNGSTETFQVSCTTVYSQLSRRFSVSPSSGWQLDNFDGQRTSALGRHCGEEGYSRSVQMLLPLNVMKNESQLDTQLEPGEIILGLQDSRPRSSSADGLIGSYVGKCMSLNPQRYGDIKEEAVKTVSHEAPPGQPGISVETCQKCDGNSQGDMSTIKEECVKVVGAGNCGHSHHSSWKNFDICLPSNFTWISQPYVMLKPLTEADLKNNGCKLNSSGTDSRKGEKAADSDRSNVEEDRNDSTKDGISVNDDKAGNDDDGEDDDDTSGGMSDIDSSQLDPDWKECSREGGDGSSPSVSDRKPSAPERWKFILCPKYIKAEIKFLENLSAAMDGKKKCDSGGSIEQVTLSCLLCGRTFKYLEELSQHMANVHGTTLDLPLKCEQCKVLFPTLIKLNEHVEVDHRCKKWCPMCGLSFGNERNRSYVSHLYIHFPCYSCKDCDARFSVVRDLMLHTSQTGHQPANKCDRCKHVAKSEKCLRRHVQKHDKSGFYKCDLCDAAIKNPWGIISHYATHPGIRIYTCPFCKKSLKSQKSVTSHVRHYHGPNICPCLICGKITPKVLLKTHMVTHARKTHGCPKCDKKFASTERVQNHIKYIHTRDHSKRPFLCDLCGKGWPSKSHLLLHQQVHSDQMFFQCDLCGKQFKRRHNLTSHFKSHSLQRDYQCDICGDRFKWKHNLENHLKTHS